MILLGPFADIHFFYETRLATFEEITESTEVIKAWQAFTCLVDFFLYLTSLPDLRQPCYISTVSAIYLVDRKF
jgi:hypothetical protein